MKKNINAYIDTDNSTISSVMPRTNYSNLQKCFYDGYGNYLCIRSSVYSSPVNTEHHRYIDITFGGGNDTPLGYPYLQVQTFDYTISSNAYYVDVDFQCRYYVSEYVYVVDKRFEYVSVTFEAGKGDVFYEFEA